MNKEYYTHVTTSELWARIHMPIGTRCRIVYPDINGVEFEKQFNGHDCHGHGKNGYCWFLNDCDMPYIRPINTGILSASFVQSVQKELPRRSATELFDNGNSHNTFSDTIDAILSGKNGISNTILYTVDDDENDYRDDEQEDTEYLDPAYDEDSDEIDRCAYSWDGDCWRCDECDYVYGDGHDDDCDYNNH